MIRHILFDLDCTLYSVDYGLEDEVSRRIQEYTISWLGISDEECMRLRMEGLKRYGTTIAWLKAEKGFTEFSDYYAYVHPENEADSLLPDPELRRFLEGLPCPCSILTNSPRSHAERIIKKLAFEGLFQYVFDIEGNGNSGKPHASAFNRALDTMGLKAEEVLFIDDHPRYAEGYIALGGRALLLDERDKHIDYPHDRIKDLRELVNYLG